MFIYNYISKSQFELIQTWYKHAGFGGVNLSSVFLLPTRAQNAQGKI